MGVERDDDELFSGPTLGADGRLENATTPVDPNEYPAQQQVSDAPIELARSTIPHTEEVLPEPPPPPPRRSIALKVIIGALVLGVAVLGGALWLKPSIPLPDGVRDSSLFHQLSIAKGQVIIMSEPMGAKVFIGDSQVGTTPWAADNRWSGDVPVRLEAKGFATFTTTFQGGKDQTLEVDLKKREIHAR
jgi:hypothetical protein